MNRTYYKYNKLRSKYAHKILNAYEESSKLWLHEDIGHLSVLWVIIYVNPSQMFLQIHNSRKESNMINIVIKLIKNTIQINIL